MKMKKWTFFLLTYKFSYLLYKNFKPRRFQMYNHLFDIFTGRKDTAFQKGLKMPILGCFWPTLTSYIFWSNKDIKKMVTYLKSSKFEVCVVNMKIFHSEEKKFILFILIFLLHFHYFSHFLMYHLFHSNITF